MIGVFAMPANERRIRIDLVNANETERALFSTLIAMLCDEAMRDVRDSFLAGEVAIGVDGGEVTWVDGPNPCVPGRG